MGAPNEVSFEEIAKKPVYQTDPKKYRKKPVTVTAYQTDRDLDIETLEGTMHANPGDWVITGVKGEQYPCKPDIFEKTYELAEKEEEEEKPVLTVEDMKRKWLEEHPEEMKEEEQE